MDKNQIDRQGVDAAIGENCIALAEYLGTRLIAAGMTLAVAESCTGGMIGAALTAVPGSSRWFRGGVIAYANDVKERILGVPADVLREHGAVSGPCVRSMAQGAAKLLDTDCAIAVSGVAGPDGGTPEKPVGLVWAGLAAPGGIETRECRFDGGRDAVRKQTVAFCLEALAGHIS